MARSTEAADQEPHKILQGRTSAELAAAFSYDEKNMLISALGRLERGESELKVEKDIADQVGRSWTLSGLELSNLSPELLALGYSYAKYLASLPDLRACGL